MLGKVAIFSKDTNDKTRQGVSRLVEEFNRRGIKVQLYRKLEESYDNPESSLVESFTSLQGSSGMPDLVLSVGGDGTFLETVVKVMDLGIPIAGVNTGRMGFLANIPAEEIGHSIDMLCSGEYEIIDRSLLRITSPDKIFDGNLSTALNEITIQKADLSMITISVYIDDKHLNTYWSDGLIVSTATGSTAYNLSVGGPILSPEDESIIISPIAPHNLTIRPIILSGNSRIRMMMEGRSHEFLVTCDFRSRRIGFNEEIQITKAPVSIRTVMLKGTDFYTTLRNKLMWGADRRN